MYINLPHLKDTKAVPCFGLMVEVAPRPPGGLGLSPRLSTRWLAAGSIPRLAPPASRDHRDPPPYWQSQDLGLVALPSMSAET